MASDFDSIVVGVGGMGSAALYHLARRGMRVLGLEQFGLAHDRGSSHGQTRIIRKAYFEHPDYVPLLHRSYELWSELEKESGQRLFLRPGLLLAGPADGVVISGVERAARQYRLQIDRLTLSDAGIRFPGFRFSTSDKVLFEPDAGFLRVEACVQAHADAAVHLGATLLTNQTVESWSSDPNAVIVRTAGAEYVARSLVMTGGAWSARLLHDLNLPLEVRRKLVFWYEPPDHTYDLDQGCPVYGFEMNEGFMYGFPAIDEAGVKVAHHSGGRVIDHPSALDRSLLAGDEEPVRRFIDQHLPRLGARLQSHSVCMYTMTPDEHFIIDRHPAHANVTFAAGFSGHGFKFASIVGSILADLVIDGRTAEPISFLSLKRPGLR